MKQQTLNLKKKLLLVELPEGCIKFVIKDYNYSGLWLLAVNDELNCPKIKVPNIKEVGKLTDITEEKFTELVDKFNHGAYRNYKAKNSFYADADTNDFFLTAKESFFSYLEKEGILFSNPYGRNAMQYASTASEPGDLSFLLREWQEAQSKVWDISRCYLFEIIQ